jgi:exodeoxyribonuclease-5
VAVADLQLNDDQAEAVDRILDWMYVADAPFVLGGYAGTGKTTVSAHLPALLGLDPADVLFLAPTNQAVRVLRRRLAAPSPTNTVFSHLYVGMARHCERCPAEAGNAMQAMEADPDAEGIPDCHVALRDDGCCVLDREARASVARYALTVVDEASMLAPDDYAALRAHGGALLLVGDPGQLPPVKSDFSAVEEPDHVLTRIMRQGEGSEILAFAAAVREGRPLPAMADPVAGEVRRLDPRASVPWHWTEADGSAGRLDAVIVQSNAVRRRINAQARAARGRDPDGPALPGDLVQANRRLNEGQIYNGMTLTVADVELGGRALVLRSDDDGYLHRVWLGDRVVDQEGCGLNYGYAFTCHKAQGSEWDRVLVYPPHAGSPAEMRRWTYTAMTRARRMLALAIGG